MITARLWRPAAGLNWIAVTSGTGTDKPRSYAYVATLITAAVGGMQAEAIALEGLRRGLAALDDLETVPLLQKAL